jgi:hypothetical protein
MPNERNGNFTRIRRVTVIKQLNTLVHLAVYESAVSLTG